MYTESTSLINWVEIVLLVVSLKKAGQLKAKLKKTDAVKMRMISQQQMDFVDGLMRVTHAWLENKKCLKQVFSN